MLVITKSRIQFVTLLTLLSTLTPTTGNSLANIDWLIVSCSVKFIEGLIVFALANVVEGINTRTQKVLLRWEVLDRRTIEEADGILYDFSERVRVEHMLASVEYDIHNTLS